MSTYIIYFIILVGYLAVGYFHGRTLDSKQRRLLQLYSVHSVRRATLSAPAVALSNFVRFSKIIIAGNLFLASFTDCSTSRNSAYDVMPTQTRAGAWWSTRGGWGGGRREREREREPDRQKNRKPYNCKWKEIKNLAVGLYDSVTGLSGAETRKRLLFILRCVKRPLNIIRNLDTKSANIDDKEVTRNGDTL